MKRSKYSAMSKLPGFIDTSKKKKRAAPKGFKGSESDLESLCEQYLEILGICYLHIPAPLLRALFASQTIPIWIKREVKKYIAHWPDLIMFKSGRYLAVELKTATGRATKGQRDRIRDMEGHIARDFETFKSLVDEWRKGGTIES